MVTAWPADWTKKVVVLPLKPLLTIGALRVVLPEGTPLYEAAALPPVTPMVLRGELARVATATTSTSELITIEPWKEPLAISGIPMVPDAPVLSGRNTTERFESSAVELAPPPVDVPVSGKASRVSVPFVWLTF
jgi:hypothetical protein